MLQLLPLSVEYCQTPSVEESAALAVMAMPRRVSLSAVSEKELLKRLATVSPEGVVASSEMAASDGLPLAVGASLTAVTSKVMVLADASVSMPPLAVPPSSLTLQAKDA